MLIVPAGLAAVALALHGTGLDRHLTDQFFDASSRVFSLRSNALLELIGHGMARSAAVLVWSCIFAGALGSLKLAELRPYRRILWLTATAMALGPIVVVVLKEVTSFPCPWNLRRYGGFAGEPDAWFVSPANAGRCFPAGHAAGGFSFVAFYFAAVAVQRRRLALVALVCALAAGTAFGFVRVVQGAHFLSHAVWAAAIDWLMAALVFAPSLFGHWHQQSPLTSRLQGDGSERPGAMR